MGIRRALTDLRELRTGFRELFARTPEEEEARIRLVSSTRRFAHNTKEVVDDKLSFSATLMRAGEVDAAHRLIEELEYDVRTEEAALIEEVNEVRVAQSLQRERITRVRLARMLVAALTGSALLTFSAMGLSLAGAFNPAEREASIQALRRAREGVDQVLSRRISARESTNRVRHLRIGDVRLLLTAAEFKQIKDLVGADVDQQGLQDLIYLLPTHLAQKVQQAITVASDAAAEAGEAADTTLATIKSAPRTAERNASKTTESNDKNAPAAHAEDKADDDAPDGPQPHDENSPEPKPSPTPSDDRDDTGDVGPLGRSGLDL